MARPLKMRQMWDEVRDVFPDVGFSEFARVINNEVIDLSIRLGKLKVKTKKMNIVKDQALYDISDGGTDAGINKVYRVDILDNDTIYVLIPRDTAGKYTRGYDEV